jgi:hypothetical protein
MSQLSKTGPRRPLRLPPPTPAPTIALPDIPSTTERQESNTRPPGRDASVRVESDLGEDWVWVDPMIVRREGY